MDRSRVARCLVALVLSIGCGAATTAATPPPSTTDDAPPTVVAERSEPPAAVPPAPGAQLAAGRLGSVLEGLAPSDARLPGPLGDAGDGPDAPSVHLLTRTTSAGEHTIRVVAWDTFAPAPDADELVSRVRRELDDEARALETSDTELSVVAAFAALDEPLYPDEEPEASLANDESVAFLAELVVGVRGGSVVRITLACELGAACRADDREALATELARSLRRGPRLEGGGEWVLRLPRGDADARVKVPLPVGFVGLAPRAADEGLVAPVIELATGHEALRVSITPRATNTTWTLTPGAPPPDTDPGGDAGLECAPFSCRVRFDASSRALLLSSFARGSVEPLPLEDEALPLARGRLTVLLPGPSVTAPRGRRDELYDPVETAVRFAGSVLTLEVNETLEPTENVLARARMLASHGDIVDRVETSDPSLSVARVVSSDRVFLVIAERDGCPLVLEASCGASSPCHADPDAFSRELARRLRRGAPLPTHRRLYVTFAGRVFDIDLPDGYVVTSWHGENHDDGGIRVHHVRPPLATIELEDSGASPGASIENVGRRTGRRTTLRLGNERIPMLERRRFDGMVSWGADLGCEETSCILLVITESLEERDRLLAAIAAGHVSRDPPCLRGIVADAEDLNVRAAPSTHARVVGTLAPETEVTIAETRGRWSRVTAPLAGWVWDESIPRVCD